MLAWSYTT